MAKKIKSKGDRLNWTPLDEVKPVHIAEHIQGTRVYPKLVLDEEKLESELSVQHAANDLIRKGVAQFKGESGESAPGKYMLELLKHLKIVVEA